MREILAITNALADENRLRALAALAGGELCVCQIAELLQLAPSTVSKHLSILRQGGLVQSRKQGRWSYYSIPDQPGGSVRLALDWVRRALQGTSRIAADARRLEAILKEDPEELCRRQLGRCRPAPDDNRLRPVGREHTLDRPPQGRREAGKL